MMTSTNGIQKDPKLGISALSELTIDADKDWNAKRITNLAAPVNDNDAARKVDAGTPADGSVTYDKLATAAVSDIKVAISNYVLGDNIMCINPTSRSTSSSTYVKLKEMRVMGLTTSPTTLRISYHILGGSVNNKDYYGRLYKNGSPYGAEYKTGAGGDLEVTEDLSFSNGDYIQVYGKCTGGSVTIYNLCIKGLGSYGFGVINTPGY